MAYPNLHKQFKDALLIASTSLPAAGANVDSASLDLGNANRLPLGMELQISVPAMAAHVDPTKSVTVSFKDSDDDSSYAAQALLPNIVVPGVASTGSAAQVVYLPIPVEAGRFLKANLAVTSAGPTLTSFKVDVAVVF